MTDETNTETEKDAAFALREMGGVRAELNAEREARNRLETEHFNLGQDRDAQRARAERAEKERDEWEQAYGVLSGKRHEAVARAERAERERDEADKRTLEMCAVQEAEMQARFRAEADNAALLEAMAREPGESWVGHSARCSRAAAQPHPGAALLERLRALEKVLADAVRWMREDGGAKVGREPCKHTGSCRWQRAEAVLLAAADALRGKA